jgi:AcrR family transcriptional regulator
MAKKPDSAKARSRRDKIIDATLTLAAEGRWRDVSLSDIAAGARVSLVQLHAEFSSRSAIVSGVMQRVDDAVLSGTDKSAAGEPAHDRLLDALLRRLDALAPHRDAIASILRDLPTDPAGVVCLAPGYFNSIAWTLESAGIASTGLDGRIRVKGVAAIYLSALRVWLRDDSEDKSATMAFLDQRLRQGARLAAMLPFGVVDRPANPLGDGA